jgi:hypothetical protein
MSDFCDAAMTKASQQKYDIYFVNCSSRRVSLRVLPTPKHPTGSSNTPMYF